MSDLIDAVKAGDAGAVEALLARDPELAGSHEDGISAVRTALYHRQPAVLEALLAAQPPLDGLDHAALGWADELRDDVAGDAELIARRSADGFTALHYACFFGGAAATAVLLEAGADPDAEAENETRVHPLHSAAAARDAESARLLLEAGADPDAQADNASRVRPLHSAAAARDIDSARLLLEAGADPNARQQGGFTPLHAAAHVDHQEMARLLLDHGADPAAQTDDGRDAARIAADDGSARVASLLAG